jgi:hypothetical protein
MALMSGPYTKVKVPSGFLGVLADQVGGGGGVADACDGDQVGEGRLDQAGLAGTGRPVRQGRHSGVAQLAQGLDIGHVGQCAGLVDLPVRAGRKGCLGGNGGGGGRVRLVADGLAGYEVGLAVAGQGGQRVADRAGRLAEGLGDLADLVGSGVAGEVLGYLAAQLAVAEPALGGGAGGHREYLRKGEAGYGPALACARFSSLPGILISGRISPGISGYNNGASSPF